MSKILKFNEYKDWDLIASDFIFNLKNFQILESDQTNEEDKFTKAIKDIQSTFKFNVELTLTFGTGVKLMYPVVSKLVENLRLEIKPTFQDIVLLCITVLAVMYSRYSKDAPISNIDIKNKLNGELKMKFGNPENLVESLISSFRHIYEFIKKFPKLFGVALSNIFDMFAYTSILIPVMNAIGAFCSDYQLTPDKLLGNLVSLGVGIASISSKILFDYMKNKVTNRRMSVSNVGEPSPGLQEIDMGKSKLIQEQ